MDIAKIRKKAKEQDAEKRPEEIPASREIAAEPAPAPEDAVEEVPGPAAAVEMVSAVEKAGGPEKEPVQPASEIPEPGDVQIELLTFRLASEEFAFRVEEVEEIIRLQKITYVPTMPSSMVGITSLRGKIIPVIDLKARLNLGSASQVTADDTTEASERMSGKILIIAGPRGFIGAMVDRVIGVVRLSRHDVLEPPAHLTEAEKKYIEGIVILDKRFISVVRSADTMDIEI
ncbi:MAG TPA: chemotaxis protein CheW [Thermodesulfovibrionales bacterium]|nr:chemotaxis protein CheW [Thermodesulfovibrionales bacterium]